MAANNPLEGEITCSVCFDIYEDPHALKECFHTYCLKCIKRFEERGQVHCPDCRTVTALKDIKKDFKTQRLIDIHKQGLTGTVVITKGGDKCGMCQNVSVPITNHCTDCDIFLCAGCSKGHQTNRALKSHKLTSTVPLTKNIGSNLKETICKLEEHVKNIDIKLQTVSQSVTDVEKAKAQQIADVRKFTQDAIKEMKKNQKHLEILVADANQALVDHFHLNKTMLEQQKKELLTKVAFLKDLIKSQDFKTLQETAESVNETIKQDIIKISRIIERKCLNLKSPVTVQKNKKWDVKESIEVSIQNIQYDSQQIGPVFETLFSELHTKTFKLIHTTELNFFPRSLSMINNQLWCPGNGCLNIFDLNCQPVKNIKLEQISNPMSVTTCGNEHIIVACFSDKGLHLLKSNGKYHSKITDGSFSSVACYDGDIFALEDKTHKIIVLRRDRNEVSSYQIQHSTGSNCDTLCVQRNGIYVSSWCNNCIYVYDKRGKFQLKRGETGFGKPGLLSYPILCDMDNAGNMLVADKNNNRLQVCDSRGLWTVIELPGKVRLPRAGVVSTEGGEMWIVSSEEPYKLDKYTMST